MRYDVLVVTIASLVIGFAWMVTEPPGWLRRRVRRPGIWWWTIPAALLFVAVVLGLSVEITHSATQVVWYFDTTWGGDDAGIDDGADRLRIYRTVPVDAVHQYDCDDVFPVDAPTLHDDELTIARWIVSVLTEQL